GGETERTRLASRGREARSSFRRPVRFPLGQVLPRSAPSDDGRKVRPEVICQPRPVRRPGEQPADREGAPEVADHLDKGRTRRQRGEVRPEDPRSRANLPEPPEREPELRRHQLRAHVQGSGPEGDQRSAVPAAGRLGRHQADADRQRPGRLRGRRRRTLRRELAVQEVNAPSPRTAVRDLLSWSLLMIPLAFALLTPVADEPKFVAPNAKLEKLWSEGEFTEGPAEGPDGCVYFSDIGNRIMKFDPKTGKTTEFRNPSGRSNGLKFDTSGRLVACDAANTGGNRRISVTLTDGTVVTLADKWNGKRFNSPNDLTLDAKGRIYFSDPRYVGDEPREIDTESVYRVDPDGKVTQVIKDVTKPNGLVIS